MPQFDFSTFPTQLFWLVVSFTTLYLILWRTALPKISGVLEARQRKIDDDLDRAAASKQEAEAVLAEYEKAVADSTARAQGTIRQAAEQMAAEATRQHEQLAAKLADDVKAAEARIVAAKKAAVQNISQLAVEVSQAAARRLADVEVDAETAGNAVKAVMQSEG